LALVKLLFRKITLITLLHWNIAVDIIPFLRVNRKDVIDLLQLRAATRTCGHGTGPGSVSHRKLSDAILVPSSHSSGSRRHDSASIIELLHRGNTSLLFNIRRWSLVSRLGSCHLGWWVSHHDGARSFMLMDRDAISSLAHD
jgi:hypothetical protein